MNSSSQVLCIGEILWDALPEGLFPGGAPLNVCYHLNRLGVRSRIVSCVGNDRLGWEILRRIRNKNMDVGLIQKSAKLETGFVEVTLDKSKDADYKILKPVAWDEIQLLPEITKAAKESWGVVFGSLAQRNDISRRTIQTLFDLPVQKIFDINLRPPFTDREIIEQSLDAADIVKMNVSELKALIAWFNLPESFPQACRVLAENFNCQTVCVTRDAAGACIWHEGEWAEHQGYEVEVVDTIGSGDAFLAALIYGIIHRFDPPELLDAANKIGSSIAAHQGAMPE